MEERSSLQDLGYGGIEMSFQIHKNTDELLSKLGIT